MTSGKLRSLLVSLHRLLALVLTPLMIVFCLSGILLGVLRMAPPPARGPVDAAAVMAALQAVDPEGSAGLLIVEPGGEAFELRSRGKGVRGRFGVASRQQLPAEEGFDLEAKTEQLHRGLLLGLNPLMEAAAFVVLALVLIGPLIVARLGWRTLLQRHAALGLIFWPLVLLPPATGVMMAAHWLEAPRPPEAPAEQRLSIARGLELAAPRLDLSRLAMARRWPSGELLVYLADGPEGRETAIHKVFADGEAAPFAPPRNWPHDLHVGAWSPAGAWLNIAGALALLTLNATGIYSWWRRRRERAAR